MFTSDSYHSNYFTNHYYSNFFPHNFFTNNFFTLFFFTGGIGRICYSQDATAFLNDFLISSGLVGDAGAPANVGKGFHGKASVSIT
jgi:hypothetical protein